MHNSLYYVLVHTILCDVIVLPRKIKNITGDKSDSEESDDVRVFPMIIQNPGDFSSYFTSLVTTKAPPPISSLGPFLGFLTNMCNALTSPKYSGKYLGKYFTILSNCLKSLGINYLQEIWIKRFRKRLNKYSIYNSDVLKAKVNDFLVFISDEKPKKNEYFRGMDAIYTAQRMT